MKLTKKNFNTLAVTVGRNHYFPRLNDINDLADSKATMDVCFYSYSRRKWLSDIAYLPVQEAKAIIAYATKHGTLLGVRKAA